MSSIVKQILVFLLYLLLQVTLFNHLTVFQVATPFAFLLFLFMLPLSTPVPVLMVIGFCCGLTVDMLSDTYANGLHAFGSLLAVSFRPRLINIITPPSYRNVAEVSLSEQSPVWTAVFLGTLIFIHHLGYFFLEAFTFSNFFYTLLKVVSSSIYSFTVCYILYLTFYKK